MTRLSLMCVLMACGQTMRAPQPDQVTPRCTTDGDRLTCTHQTDTLHVGVLDRVVHWQVPTGTAPTAGWPVVIMFQGSTVSASRTWSAVPSDSWGGLFQTQVVQALLEHGFSVLAPEAKVNGSTWWDTNIVPYSTAWTTSDDHALMLAIFNELNAGTFGPFDASRLYAAGISSGGYMTSRMADAYPGKFKALVIESASWASCGGPVCVLPGKLPTDHPPTLFLHGEMDSIVPISTARAYDAQLKAEGHEERFVSDPNVGHQWLSVAPTEVLNWVTSH